MIYFGRCFCVPPVIVAAHNYFQHLVASNVCTPKNLACKGGSNGGLLTGNMLVQAPDLFAAIHIAVPLLDMKR